MRRESAFGGGGSAVRWGLHGLLQSVSYRGSSPDNRPRRTRLAAHRKPVRKYARHRCGPPRIFRNLQRPRMRRVRTRPPALSGRLARIVSDRERHGWNNRRHCSELRRNVFKIRGRDRSALIDRVDRAIALLAESTGKRPEPLVNIAVFHERGEWVTYLFPRGKHRPQVFHTGELMVSPASIDLCGIFVVPLAHDFARIAGDAISAIFREVTLPDDQFQEVARKLESKP